MECHCCLRNIQDLMSDGKALVRDGADNHSMAWLFILVTWSNITLFLPETGSDCMSSARKSYQVSSLDARCTAMRIMKGDILLTDIGDSELVHASEIQAQDVTEV